MRIVLVLDDHAVANTTDAREGRAQVVVQRRDLAALHIAPGRKADFGAVPADGGKPQRIKQPVHFADRAAADESDGAAKGRKQRRKCCAQFVRHLHVERRRRDIEQSAVDVEKDCRRVRIGQTPPAGPIARKPTACDIPGWGRCHPIWFR